jgi:hypothetical protein
VSSRTGLDDVEKRKFLTHPGLEEPNIVHARMRQFQTNNEMKEEATGMFNNSYKTVY